MLIVGLMAALGWSESVDAAVFVARRASTTARRRLWRGAIKRHDNSASSGAAGVRAALFSWAIGDHLFADGTRRRGCCAALLVDGISARARGAAAKRGSPNSSRRLNRDGQSSVCSSIVRHRNSSPPPPKPRDAKHTPPSTAPEELSLCSSLALRRAKTACVFETSVTASVGSLRVRDEQEWCARGGAQASRCYCKLAMVNGPTSEAV